VWPTLGRFPVKSHLIRRHCHRSAKDLLRKDPPAPLNHERLQWRGALDSGDGNNLS
jgi:hypothetical protein